MSTKTSIKRIAAVAAVALTLGGFSAVSAHATATSSSATILASGLLSGGTGTAAGTQVVGGIANVTITETTTGTAVAGDILGTVSTSGVGSIAGSVGTVDTALYALGSAQGAPSYSATSFSVEAVRAGTGGNTGQAVVLTLTSAVAGVQTISFTPIGSTGAPGTAVTATITWGAAPVVSAQYSTAYINSVATAPTSTSTASSASGTVANGQAANIVVTLRSGVSTTINAGISASITGPGLLGYAAGGSTYNAAATARSVSSTSAEAAANSSYNVTVWPDGTTGTATVTIVSGTVAIATKTITFYGSAKAVTASQNLKVLKAAGTAGNAAGNVYTGTTSAYSASTVLVAATTTAAAYGTDSSAAATTGFTAGNAPITAYTTDSSGNASKITVNYGTNIKILISDTSVLTAVGCYNVDAASTSTG
jgi:hypothetical protein